MEYPTYAAWYDEVSRRPPAVKQPPLPPWDSSDPGGLVHTIPPPELHVPEGKDRRFWRGDHSGVMLPFVPPYVPGANTTPPNMILSYFLPLYNRQVQDAILTAHAERNYTHFVLTRYECDRAGLSVQAQVDLVKYVQSWGFYVAWWATSSADNRRNGWADCQRFIQPFLMEYIMSGGNSQKLIVLPGEELNNGVPPGPAGADSIIANTCAICNSAGIDVWLHFTSNYPAWPMPPPDGNIDAADVAWWRQWVGRVVGLCWQGNQNEPAGLMGARMYDARRILGWADPSLLLSAFELLATKKLYGQCTEEYGCLRGLEMLYCPNGGTGFPAVAGACDGLRYPDGSPV